MAGRLSRDRPSLCVHGRDLHDHTRRGGGATLLSFRDLDPFVLTGKEHLLAYTAPSHAFRKRSGREGEGGWMGQR